MPSQILPCAEFGRRQIRDIICGSVTPNRTSTILACIAATVAKWSLATFDASLFGAFSFPRGSSSISIASGSAVVNDGDATFLPSDVGSAIDIQGAGNSGSALRSTIIGYTSASQVTIADIAFATVAATLTSAAGLAVWGQGAAVVGPSVQRVATIAALRALGAAPTADGQLVQVERYSAVSDQGGGSFVWDANNTGTDDGGSLIAITGITFGRFVRLFNARAFVTIEEFGGGSFVGSNTAALNAAAAWCSTAPATCRTIKFGYGTYTFNTKPNDFTAGIIISGENMSVTALIRNYTAGSTSEGFLTWNGPSTNGGGCERCQVYAATGTSSGQMLRFSTNTTPSGFNFCKDVTVTYGGTGDWYCAVMVDGSANVTAGSQGQRDFVMTGCFLFAANVSTKTLQLINATNHFVDDTWTNGDVLISGSASANSQTNVGSLNISSLGLLTIEFCTRVSVYGTLNNLTLNSSADKVHVDAQVIGTVTDNSSTSSIVLSFSTFNGAKGAAGYQKFPSGNVCQWFTAASIGTAFSAFSYPVGFVTACDSVQATSIGGATSTNVVVNTSPGTSSCQLAASNAGQNAYVTVWGH